MSAAEWPDEDLPDRWSGNTGDGRVEQPESDDQTPGPGGSAAPYFPDLATFVSELLAPMYRRSTAANSVTWCAEWWRHGEAIARLHALWRAWEHLRLDPATGMSVWFSDHADHHMRVLLDAEGPFKGCTPEKHSDRLAALPVTPPDPEVFSEPDDTTAR